MNLISSIIQKSGCLKSRTLDPSTSQDALDSIAKSKTIDRIVLALNTFGADGLTSSQVADHLSLSRDSVSPVMPVLERAGRVVRSGYVRKLPGRRGQIVWVSEDYKDVFKPCVLDEIME